MRSCRTRRRSQRYTLISKWRRQVAAACCPRIRTPSHLSFVCFTIKGFSRIKRRKMTASANYPPRRPLKHNSIGPRSTNPHGSKACASVAHASPRARARARSVSLRAHARPPRECHSALPLLRRPHPISTVRQRWVFRAGFYGAPAALMRVCVAGVAHLCPALRAARRCALTLASAPAQVPRPC